MFVDKEKQACGIAGSVETIAQTELSSQPICSFDWSADRAGLFTCVALDQCVYVGMATKLEGM